MLNNNSENPYCGTNRNMLEEEKVAKDEINDNFSIESGGQ